MIMKVMFAWCFLVLILMKQADATPLSASEITDPEEEGPENEPLKNGEVLFEGDILLNGDQANEVDADEITIDSQRGMSASNAQWGKWPGNTLYYDLSRVSGWRKHPNFIRKSVKLLQAKLDNCIKFVESTTATNRVKVTGNDVGCLSMEGMQGGVQNLNLHFSIFGNSCKKIGTVQHEFLHALGFFHTQMRSDRDDFITIHKENIKTGQEGNFGIYDMNNLGIGSTKTMDLPFDLGSVMMYPQTAFGISGAITITTKDPKWQKKIGQRKGLSAKDVEMVKTAYGCK